MTRRNTLLAIGFFLLAATNFVLLTLVAEWRDAAPTPVITAEGERQGRVVEVLAADQVRLASGEIVHLAALTVPAPGEPFAEGAALAVQALTEDQAVRILGPTEAAYIYLPSGELLQDLLVAGGYARVAEDAPDEGIAALLRGAEEEARAANLGIWGGSPPVTLAAPATIALPEAGPIACEPGLLAGESVIGPDEAAARLGETVTVIFLPVRASDARSRGVTLLDGPQESSFGVIIPIELYAGATVPTEAYVNRCLAVTGQVERDVVNNAPRIIINDLDEVLVLR